MVTHPMVVKAAVEYVLHKGARPQVSDSPAMGSWEKVLKESGISQALQGLDVLCTPFRKSVAVDVGEPFHRIEIAEDALCADVVLNLPKLKTHSQMLLTLGVKNLFGCIVGLRKPEWHFRTGVDREMFANLLACICRKVNPTVTVLDGILAMEGQGPGKGGTARHLGRLLAGTGAAAVDVAVCSILGLEEDRLLTNRAAKKLGLLREEVELDGDFRPVNDFKLPGITPLVFGPSFLHKTMRKHLVQRPVPASNLCKACGDCRRYCPAGAIEQKSKTLIFDYDKCIRCYCCIEVCPYGALRAEEPLLGRIFTEIRNRLS